MGDAVYLMQCKPVQVHIAIPKFCSDELPVLCNNTYFYLVRGSRVLTKQATKISCSELTPVIYKIDGIWYKSDGKTLTQTKTPQKLRLRPNSRAAKAFN